jgi:hypothetical protein
VRIKPSAVRTTPELLLHASPDAANRRICTTAAESSVNDFRGDSVVVGAPCVVTGAGVVGTVDASSTVVARGGPIGLTATLGVFVLIVLGEVRKTMLKPTAKIAVASAITPN